METILLVLIGLTAVCYVGHLLWKESKGEGACHCSSGGKGAGCKGCPGAK